jgi:hypothetical protein
VLNHCTIANPLLFQTNIGLYKGLLPVSNISLGCLNVNSSTGIVFFEEFDFNGRLSVEAFHIVTLFLTRNAIGLDCNSNMLRFLGAFSLIIHYVIGVVLSLSESPLLTELVALNILLKIVPDSSWLDGISIHGLSLR